MWIWIGSGFTGVHGSGFATRFQDGKNDDTVDAFTSGDAANTAVGTNVHFQLLFKLSVWPLFCSCSCCSCCCCCSRRFFSHKEQARPNSIRGFLKGRSVSVSVSVSVCVTLFRFRQKKDVLLANRGFLIKIKCEKMKKRKNTGIKSQIKRESLQTLHITTVPVK